MRRHLFEQFAGLRLRDRRGRRRLRHQIALLSAMPPDGGGDGDGDDGPTGVREPRRPMPPHNDVGRALTAPE